MNKLFKTYIKLIDSFHKYYEERNTDIYENTNFQMKNQQEEYETQIQQKTTEFENEVEKNKKLQSEIDKLKTELHNLHKNYEHLRRDHILLENQNVENCVKLELSNESLAFYKYRVDEIKQKYNDSSSDDEDLIRKVVRKAKPKEKLTDTTDLQDYIDGKEIIPDNSDDDDDDIRRKEQELKKLKERNLPKTIHIQTEHFKGVDYQVQIEDGEEIIEHVDLLSKSMYNHPLSLFEIVPDHIEPEITKEEQKKHEIRIHRPCSAIEFHKTLANQDFVHEQKTLQKVITQTDLYKLKCISVSLHDKIAYQMKLNSESFQHQQSKFQKILLENCRTDKSLRLYIKFLKQKTFDLNKTIKRLNFEKEVAEAENYDLRDKLEVIKIKAANNENIQDFYSDNEFGPVEYDAEGKPISKHP